MRKKPLSKQRQAKIKFHKHLLWLKPYTEAVSHLVNIDRLKEVNPLQHEQTAFISRFL